MLARTTISCDEHVAFVISFGVSPALKHPLWLRLPSNENLRTAGKNRLQVIDGGASLSTQDNAHRRVARA